jgi:hypothetical protein
VVVVSLGDEEELSPFCLSDEVGGDAALVDGSFLVETAEEGVLD